MKRIVSGQIHSLFLAVSSIFLVPLVSCGQQATHSAYVSADRAQENENYEIDLDALVEESGAKNLVEFLEEDSLHRSYKEAMMKLLGPKLTDQNFNWVRKDILRVAQAESSGPFVKRTWEKDFYGQPIALKASNQKFRPVQGGPSLPEILNKVQQELKQNSASTQEDWVRNACANLSEEYSQIGASNESDVEVKKKRDQFLAASKKSVEFRKLASWLLQNSLTSFVPSEVQPNAGLSIAEVYTQLQSRVRTVSDNYGCTLAAFAQMTLSTLLPTEFLQLAKTSKESFTIGFEFRPISRALHSYWKGLPCDECVGGQKEKDLTPERWATAALPNSVYYKVFKISPDKGRTYLGFVQIIPIKETQTNRVYGSIEASAPELSGSYSFLQSNGEIFHGSVIESFLMEFGKSLPFKWDGIIKGNGRGANSGGVAGTIFKSKVYTQGRILEDSKAIKHFDETFASFLIGMGHQYGSAGVYGGNMITDATAKGSFGRQASELRVLAADALETFAYTKSATAAEIQSAISGSK